jgi:acyl dehydratase
LSDATHTIRPATVEDLLALAERTLGPTSWHHVTQERIDGFADITGDHQWIHVEPARAASSAYGSTIAHGLYSLSLGPQLFESLLRSENFTYSVNYGYEKVRFPAPLPVGSRIRMHATVLRVEDLGHGSAHMVTRQTFEREGFDKPVCVADSASRYYE